MHVGRHLRVRAARFNFNATVSVVFVREHAEGRVVQNFEPFEEREISDFPLPETAELQMSPEQAMELMAELWDLGMRPRGKVVEPDQFERERKALEKLAFAEREARDALVQSYQGHIESLKGAMEFERGMLEG